MKKHALINSIALALIWSAGAQAYAESPNVLFVLDGSGSMWAKMGEKPKIDIAKTVMTDMLRQLPSDVRAGLIVYGHNRKDDCNDIAVVAPIGSDRASIVQALHNVSPKGKTPLTGAIQLAATQLRQSESNASVVVVSDGKETCGGDPCAAAREAANTGVNLRIHVVGFDVAQDETQQLNCIATEGKGKYFAANNAEQLVVALAEVQKEMVTPPPPPVQVVQAPAPAPASSVLFEDHFDRDDLGEMWEILNHDPNRLAVTEGQLLIVAASSKEGETPKNLVLSQQKLSGDFIATVRLTMQVTKDNSVNLNYWIDNKNYLALGVYGFKETGDVKSEGRHVGFIKFINGEPNRIWQFYSDPRFSHLGSIGDRQLQGYATKPEVWHFQIERKGMKYIGRVSVDGVQWNEVGIHTVLNKNGKIGVSANSGEGIENTAEFDDFVVKGAK